MNNLNRTQISPLQRNGINAYLQRYLNTITDWQTYSEAIDTAGFSQQVKNVTAAYFGSRKLKGLSLLLAAHLLQQVTASLVSIAVRTWLGGQVLETYRGIAVRQSQASVWWQHQMPDWLQARLQVVESAYFHEAGRTWHNHTLEVTFSGRVTKTLAVLSLLSLPNRVFYFDRPLKQTDAVELALGVKDADSIPGFIGDLRELDTLLPFIRLLKLALYGLNWYLVDEAERDHRGPGIVGYNELNYPSGPLGGGSAVYPPAPPNDNRPYDAGGPYPYHRSGGYGYTPASPSLQTPYALAPHIAGSTAVTLVQAPLRLKLGIQRPDGRQDPLWYTVEEHGYLVYNGDRRQTGLGVAPMLEAQADGAIRELTSKWSVVHLETGHLLNDRALDSIYQARELAGLLAAIDWTQPFDQTPRADLERAQQIIGDFVKAVDMATYRAQSPGDLK